MFRQGSTAPPDEGNAAFDRIVVGVDPPAGAGEASDACGIVVCGVRGEALYVLQDATVRGLSPEGWASRVAAAAARWNTAQVVAEANNGAAMVESVLKAADYGLRVRLVHASRGKSGRAEPMRSSSRRAKRSSRASFRSSMRSSAEWSPVVVTRGPGGRRTARMRWCGR